MAESPRGSVLGNANSEILELVQLPLCPGGPDNMFGKEKSDSEPQESVPESFKAYCQIASVFSMAFHPQDLAWPASPGI